MIYEKYFDKLIKKGIILFGLLEIIIIYNREIYKLTNIMKLDRGIFNGLYDFVFVSLVYFLTLRRYKLFKKYNILRFFYLFVYLYFLLVFFL